MGSRSSARSSGAPSSKDKDAKKKVELKKALPAVWELLKPRRWLLIGGFGLMIINRISGLVLPASTKFLVDNVMNRHPLVLPKSLGFLTDSMARHHDSLLPILVGSVLTATFIQGITSFTLTQLLAKAAQRLIP